MGSLKDKLLFHTKSVTKQVEIEFEFSYDEVHGGWNSIDVRIESEGHDVSITKSGSKKEYQRANISMIHMLFITMGFGRISFSTPQKPTSENEIDTCDAIYLNLDEICADYVFNGLKQLIKKIVLQVPGLIGATHMTDNNILLSKANGCV